MGDTSQDLFIQRTSMLNGINTVGKILRKVGLDPFKLKYKDILKSGIQKSGFTGTLPLGLEEGLSELVNSINQESKVNPFGALAIKGLLNRTVYQRLMVEKNIAAHPQILERPIKAPVFIIGMPRTGTTILHALLNEDVNTRSPLAWECLLPYPVSTPASYTNNDQLKTVEKEFGQLFKLVPDFQKKHHMSAVSPQECIGVNFLDFNSFQTSAQVYIPSYMDWFMHKADKSRTMAWHKRFLQFLESGEITPERWLLKSPVHLVRLKEIFEVYPDAKIIMTHRHPSKVVASATSLISSVRSLYSDNEDPLRSGDEQCTFWSEAFEVFLEQRKNLNKEDQIIDLKFEDFIGNQMAVVEQIYERFNWQLSDESKGNMQTFLKENPPGKHGVHNYTLEQFGLNEQIINKKFKNYIDFIEKL